MANDDDADDLPQSRYDRLVRHFSDLTIAWQQHRDTVNRAVGILSHEILQVRDWMARDDRQRAARQEQLDGVLARLEQSDRAIRRWQWFRVAIELIAALVVVAFIIGFLWER
jgi:hypothetical protein